MLGEALHFLGEFAQNRAHLEQAIALYDPRQHGSHILLYGNDTGVGTRLNIARTLWMLGYPDQGLKRLHEGTALAQELAHPFTQAMALSVVCWVHQLRRDSQLTLEQAEASIALSTEYGFVLFSGTGMIRKGWALVEQGQVDEGIAQIQQGLVASQAIGAEIFRLHGLAVLAETYGKAGKPDQGLTVLADALATVEKNEERFYEAEMYRLKGQLTLQKLSVPSSQLSVPDPRPLTSDPQGEAEACFLKAIDIARRQQAKSLELRAVMSLARLWQSQGKQAEARRMLAEIYGWFTEGFDTVDLKEAKALLEELTAGG
jgi:predicted ATPase